MASSTMTFFRTERRNGRWWLRTPAGEPFWSIGINHIDPAAMLHAGEGSPWHERYGNSMQRWLAERVRPDLLAWGFNTVGWVQEVVTRGDTNHSHSRSFTPEEYQWLDMPYCHMLPFAPFHQWDAGTRNPDLRSKDFDDWCDYVARSECARLAHDPKLIGYFYVDCPTWVHTQPWSQWKGALFDPGRLNSDAGRRELHELASRYYRVTRDAVHRYDPNHLILGDRYEALAALPDQVLEAALPFVDVLSFQHFGPTDQVRRDLDRWGRQWNKPVLLADAGGSTALSDGTMGPDVRRHRDHLAGLRQVPSCIGYHLCGAYLRNRVRNRGLRTEHDEPIPEAIGPITEANREQEAWFARMSQIRASSEA